MSKVHGASKVAHVKNAIGMKKQITGFVAILIGIMSVGLSPAFALDERLIDVVEVTWNGAPALRGDAKVVAGVIDTEVNTDWKKYTTMVGDDGARTVSFKTGKVLDTPISLLSKMPCTGFKAADFISSIRPEAYRRLGISDYSNRYLVVVSPRAGCVWSGRAQLGGPKSKSGTIILHDSESSFVIAHELGHTFGLGHSNFLHCEDKANDGPWGTNCKGVEYGGTIDVMGNVDTTSPLSTYHQWRMGLLDDSQVKQVWQSEVVNLAPSDFSKGLKAIFIRDGKAGYWIEYRRRTDGVVYKPGLAVYRLDPPPVSAIVSVNPEDGTAAEFPSVLGTDFWMLNLDNYTYNTSSSLSGSMTGLTAKFYSGNVSLKAVASETGAVVTITKKADTTPPPVPNVLPVDQWRSPSMVILGAGDEDADTAIVGFEGQIDGKVEKLKASDVEGWMPTYLSPFVAPKTFYLRDLPEGSFNFAMRAIDIVGNKSDWSQTQKVVIDRAHPVVTNDFALTGVAAGELSLQWKGATDAGSGICQANVVDEDGLILASSSVKNAPVLKVPSGTKIVGTAQVFDCIGNGQAGDMSISSTLVSAVKSSKTGKWSAAGAAFGAGAIKCVGKCTASLTVSGKNDVLVGTGAATVAVGNKTVATIVDSKSAKLRVGATIDIGASKKVVHVSGSNFVLIGLSSVTTTLGALEKIDRAPATSDPSLVDSKQVALAKLGFRSDDFSQEWTVLPMANGTTLSDPSLDFCNGTYASEKDRVERRQVTATKVGSTLSFLSTEVVKYSSAAAASAAQKELVKVLAQCQIDKGYKDSTGTLVPYEFKKLPAVPTGVVSDGNRVFVHAIIDTDLRARTLLGFYQFNGDTFTGLYVMNADGFSDAQVAKWMKVAATMGQRLQGKTI
ncbi:MAG: hypothetical protein RL590_1443 [Actinomycetota bacterium]|jgi:hypothetical protein